MVTTIQALADRGGRDDHLIAAGEVLDLKFASNGRAPVLSLRAAKLLHFLVNAAGAEACELQTHSMRIEELNRHFHLSLEDFLNTCRELFQAEVSLEYRSETGRRVLKRGPMLCDVERDLDEVGEKDPAMLRWEFSPVLRLVLSGSHHWAALSKKAVLAFESRYSLRLYEIVSIRKGLSYKHEERFEVDDLRARLGIPPEKLKSFGDVKKYALDPAVAEVNQLTGLEVSYSLVKRGRGGKVAEVILKWGSRDATGRAKAARELEASRVGRKARRTGAVETIAAADEEVRFPEDGTISFSPVWRAIATASLPQPRPDFDLVGSAFVSWAKRKNVSLNKPTTSKAFATFCQKWQIKPD